MTGFSGTSPLFSPGSGWAVKLEAHLPASTQIWLAIVYPAGQTGNLLPLELFVRYISVLLPDSNLITSSSLPPPDYLSPPASLCKLQSFHHNPRSFLKHV